jgi:hypothetical protein
VAIYAANTIEGYQRRSEENIYTKRFTLPRYELGWSDNLITDSLNELEFTCNQQQNVVIFW